MAKHRPASISSFEDSTTEHSTGDPIYHAACQDLIDQTQWAGTAPPEFPAKVIVHHLDAEDTARHIYKRD